MKTLKEFDAISFLKHLQNNIEREEKQASRFKNAKSIMEAKEYIYHCGKQNALFDLLEDMDLFAKFEEDEKEK